MVRNWLDHLRVGALGLTAVSHSNSTLHDFSDHTRTGISKLISWCAELLLNIDTTNLEKDCRSFVRSFIHLCKYFITNVREGEKSSNSVFIF